MKKITALLILLAILISCSGCSLLSFVMGGGESHMPAPSETTDNFPTVDTSDYSPTEPMEIPCQNIQISIQALEFVNNGDSWTLTVQCEPADATEQVTYSVADPSVATVDENGVVTAVGPGTTVVTVTCGSASTTVIVKCNFAAENTGYKYDIGSPIDNPTEADIQLFYDMVKSMEGFWTSCQSFVSAQEDPYNIEYAVLDQIGGGTFVAYDFHFYSEYVDVVSEETGEEWLYERYYVDDFDWILKAVYDREPDRTSMPEYYDRYIEDGYYYRLAAENYMGNPCTDILVFKPKHEQLNNGNWKFDIQMTTLFEYDENTEHFILEFEAVPMHSADKGTYWRIISCKCTQE